MWTFNSTLANNTIFPICEEKLALPAKLLILVAAGFLSLTTVLGNLLIVLVYYQNKKARSLSSIHLVSLAFTDMFIGFYPTNMNIMEMVIGFWPLGRTMCHISLSLDYVSVQSSINHIVLITFDRYLSIKSPIKHRFHQKTSKVFLKIFSAWLFAILFWVPYLNFYQYAARNDTDSELQCYNRFLKNSNISFKRYFLALVSLLGYFTPLFTVILLYVKMYRIIKKQLWETSQFGTANDEEVSQLNKIHSPNGTLQRYYKYHNYNFKLLMRRKRIMRHKKSLRMIAGIILAFIITGLPLNAQWLLVAFCPACHHQLLFDITNFLTYPNSTCNPFLYAFVSRTFSLQFKKFLICKKRSAQQTRKRSCELCKRTCELRKRTYESPKRSCEP